MNTKEILEFVYNLPSKEREVLSQQILDAVARAKENEEIAAWKKLCKAFKEWKEVAGLDELIVEAEVDPENYNDLGEPFCTEFMVSLNEKESGDVSLSQY